MYGKTEKYPYYGNVEFYNIDTWLSFYVGPNPINR